MQGSTGTESGKKIMRNKLTFVRKTGFRAPGFGVTGKPVTGYRIPVSR